MNKIKSEKAIEDSEKALDVVDNLSVTTTEIASTATPFVEINTTEETGRKTLNFNIPASKQGKSYRHRGIWASSLTYYNNDLYIDTVTFNGCTYYAKLTNSAKEPLDLADNTYWGLLAQRGGSSNVVINDVINAIYPIGSIYMSVNVTSPETLFGGNWEQLKDRFLLSAGDYYSAGQTGGESSHVLQISELPGHNHNISISDRSITGSFQFTDNDGGDNYYVKAKAADGVFSIQNASGHYFVNSNGSKSGTYSTGINMNATHNHTGSSTNTGNNSAHNNMPPYLVVYMWKRTS